MAGRPKIFSSPEKLWEVFTEYKKFVKNNPVLVEDYVGKDAKRVLRERECPLTMEGFDDYCFSNGICEGLDQYFSNRDERYTEFVGICSRIKNSIRQDQIRGGMVGIYNPSITQRLNGLTEKTENKTQLSATIDNITGMEIK